MMSSSRDRLILVALLNGYSSYAKLQFDQINSMKQQQLADHDENVNEDARLQQFKQSLHRCEHLAHHYRQLCIVIRKKIRDNDQFITISSDRISHSSISTDNNMINSQQLIDALMGSLQFEIKGITGFARLTAGDTFQVSIRHDAQKWKTRGRTQSNKLQIWNESSSCTIVCKHQHIIHLKACEVRTFGQLRLLSEQTFTPVQLISAQSQLITINLNAVGTIKLQLVVTWIPMTTLSNPQIIQRQSITDINRQSNNCTVRSNYFKLRPQLNNLQTMHRFGEQQFTTCHRSNHSSIRDASSKPSSLNKEELLISSTIDRIKTYVDGLLATYPELVAFDAIIDSCSAIIKRRHQLIPSYNHQTFEDIDDNVLMHNVDDQTSSENDSGIHSMRMQPQQYTTSSSSPSPRHHRNTTTIRYAADAGTRTLINTDQDLHSAQSAIIDAAYREINQCIKHHLDRCLLAIKDLSSLNVSKQRPFGYRQRMFLSRIDQETLNLDEMLQIARLTPLPNLTNVLATLDAGIELQDVWLSVSYPLNAVFIVPSDALKCEIRQCFGRIVSTRYPHLVDHVIETLMHLLTDHQQWNPSFVSLFQFVGAFRGKHVLSFVESLAHEAWIIAGLRSQSVDNVRIVMDRLICVPVVPPIETIRNIGLILASAQRELHPIIECYLKSTKGQLRADLISCYSDLVEHDDDDSRRGASTALAILNNQSDHPDSIDLQRRVLTTID